MHSGVVSMKRTPYLRVNERVPTAGTIEALYLSVLDFENRA